MSNKQIESITLKQELDTDPDLSYLGEYVKQPDAGVVDRRTGKLWEELSEEEQEESLDHARHSRSLEFFKPYAGGEKPWSEHYRTYAMQDFKRMEAYENGNWCCIGISAVANVSIELGKDTRKLDTLTSGGLWGIESDAGEEHLEEIRQEQLSELHTVLDAYGFSKAQITKAVNTVTLKECEA